MSLLCRLKNLVHKGILKEKDLERIVIIPKDQQSCEYAVNCEDLEECKELMTDINGDTVYAVRMSDVRRLPPVTPKPNDKALKIISETMMDMVNNKPFEEVMGNLENNMREMGIEVPILKEQEPFNAKPKTGHCKDCKWWKDSDGAFRRGIGAESRCPLNRVEVYEGSGYCYMFEPQESENKE